MKFKRCGCPIWGVGTVDGRFIRKSLDLTNWETAQARIREWEADENISGETTAAEACEKFIADCKARFLSEDSIDKYELTPGLLKEEFGTWNLKRVTAAEFDRFRASWDVSAQRARKHISRLRTFFRFCVDRELMGKNPAVNVKLPKVKSVPTVPVSDPDFEKLIWATDIFSTKGRYGESNRKRIRAFLNVLNFSGLRIRDVTCLRRDSLTGNKLFLYTQKTGEPVFVPLPESVANELRDVAVNETYFFWSGHGKPKTAVAHWQRTLSRLGPSSETPTKTPRARE